MADIFLSYASEDVARARRLAQALEGHDWSLWWDRSILPGKVFDTVIEAELAAAKCVIVLWSVHSVESRWVRAEAGEALDRGLLIPVLLDDIPIPLVFRQVQAAPLIDWTGTPEHPGFQQLLHAITGLISAHRAVAISPNAAEQQHPEPMQGRRDRDGEAAAIGANESIAKPTMPESSRKSRSGGRLIGAVSLLALAAAGGFVYYGQEERGVRTFPDADTDIAAMRSDPQPLPAPDSVPAPRTIPAGDAAEVPEIDLDTTEGSAPNAGTEDGSVQRPAKPVIAPVERETAPARSPRLERSGDETVPPVAAGSTPKQEIIAAPQKSSTDEETTPKTAAVVADPVTVLAVVWAMPNDEGTASDTRVREYSAHLADRITAVLRDALNEPVRFEYHYPNQAEYRRLLRDEAVQGENMALCTAKGADFIVSGFVKGAEFVSPNFGYALTRDPVFSVFDCTRGEKLSRSYQVAASVGDKFPFEQSLTAVFRDFIQEETGFGKD